jgi:hypothetical protein
MLASPLADSNLSWSGSRGRRPELCHWAVLICDTAITREKLRELLFAGSDDVIQLGLVFELRRTGESLYEVANMPDFTLKDLVTLFPDCRAIYAGTTHLEEAEILTLGNFGAGS